MKYAARIAILVFSLVALAHLLRFIFRIEVIVGGIVIPLWLSLLGTFITALIAVLLWREVRRN